MHLGKLVSGPEAAGILIANISGVYSWSLLNMRLHALDWNTFHSRKHNGEESLRQSCNEDFPTVAGKQLSFMIIFVFLVKVNMELNIPKVATNLGTIPLHMSCFHGIFLLMLN